MPTHTTSPETPLPGIISLVSADRHLDLGCGAKPRNPYRRTTLYGVDIAPSQASAPAEIRQANLSLVPIPFDDGYFQSVSAYDFLEHVPRILPCVGGHGTRFPFIELMNEIWRVLAPGGLFYAQTPAYPHATAFQDPTHVNILTDESHTYFTQPQLMARMYGFTGTFALVRSVRNRQEFEYEPPNPNWMRRIRLRQRVRRGAASHLIWEFQAVK